MTGLNMQLLSEDSTGYHNLNEIVVQRPRLESDMMKRLKRNYTCEFACKFHNLSKEEITKTQKAKCQLFLASGFCFIFMVVELLGGYIANSLALMSDAAHLLSDFAGLMISITALWLTQRHSDTSKHSYGFHRAEIIGAMFSIFLIWGLTIWLIYEAISRLINPQKIDGEMMFIVACLGILVNVIMGAILFQGGHHSHGLGGGGHDHSHGDHKKHENHNHSHSHDEHNHDDHGDDEHHDENKNINVRSAFVHVLGDLVQSVGVMIAGAFIWYDHEKFRFMDPVCTLIFSVIVIFTTISIMKDALAILMENVPKNVKMGVLEEKLRNLPDVADLHDLHVWNLTVGKPALSVHLLAKSNTIDNNGKIVPACVDGILRRAQKLVAQEFGIEHSTIQIEWPREIHSSHMHSNCPEYCSPRENNIEHDHDHIDHQPDHHHDHNHDDKYDEKHNHKHDHKPDEHDHKDHKHEHHHDHKHDHNHDHKPEHDHNHSHEDHKH